MGTVRIGALPEMRTRDPSSERTDDAEARLVQRAKERSPSAWAEIYDAHYRKLYRYCYARTNNESTAADLASKVYVEALESIDRYVYRGRPLLAWLYRIARNVVSDHLRAMQREMEAVQQAATLQEPHDPGPASQVGDRQDLEAAFQHLTEDHQQGNALRHYAGLTTADAGPAQQRSERPIQPARVPALAAMRRLLVPDSQPEIEPLSAEK